MNRAVMCPEIELDLIATATGDADPATAGRVERHIGACASCDAEYWRYRSLDHVVDAVRSAAAPTEARKMSTTSTGPGTSASRS